MIGIAHALIVPSLIDTVLITANPIVWVKPLGYMTLTKYLGSDFSCLMEVLSRNL